MPKKPLTAQSIIDYVKANLEFLESLIEQDTDDAEVVEAFQEDRRIHSALITCAEYRIPRKLEKGNRCPRCHAKQNTENCPITHEGFCGKYCDTCGQHLIIIQQPIKPERKRRTKSC